MRDFWLPLFVVVVTSFIFYLVGLSNGRNQRPEPKLDPRIERVERICADVELKLTLAHGWKESPDKREAQLGQDMIVVLDGVRAICGEP